MLTNLFISLGWSRDDLKFYWIQLIGGIVSVAGLIADNAFDVSYWAKYVGIPLSEHGLHVILAAAMGVVWIASRARRSSLPSAAAMASGSVPGSPIVTRISVVLLACVLAGAAALSMTACASTAPPPTKAAAVADNATKVEQSANVILHAAQQGNSDILPSGRPLISNDALVAVALAVNKIGHLGIDLKSALADYAAALKAGADVGAQRAVATKVLADIATTLADIGKAIPSGTLSAIDQAVTDILFVLNLVKGGLGL